MAVALPSRLRRPPFWERVGEVFAHVRAVFEGWSLARDGLSAAERSYLESRLTGLEAFLPR